jgi:hypothetical protein
MNRKILSALAAAFALVLVGCDSGAALPGAAGGQSVELKSTDMVHGSKDAKVTMIEYASMTCPHCAAFQAQVVPLLRKDYIDTGKVKLIFREYPLDGPHAHGVSGGARCFSGDQYFLSLIFFRESDELDQGFRRQPADHQGGHHRRFDPDGAPSRHAAGKGYVLRG